MEVRYPQHCHIPWSRSKFLKVRRIHKAVSTSRWGYLGAISEAANHMC